jgi:archaetidylinositol phosphate synthase
MQVLSDGSPELVRPLGHLPVAIRDPGGRVGGPANGDALVADDDVRMMVSGLGDLGNAIHEGDPVEVSVEVELPLECPVDFAPSTELAHKTEYATTPAGMHMDLFRRSLKQGATIEYVCDYVFRPLAHLVVLALLPLRVPPSAVVLASGGVGIVAAIQLARGQMVSAAVLILLKTVLDNADGQLARASGRISALGRYLDSESDLLVNAALFAALGYVTGQPLLAAVAFVVLTIVLSVNFNLRRLYQTERGEADDSTPHTEGVGVIVRRIYEVVYLPQDRLVEAFVQWRLRRLRAGDGARLAFHDRATILLLHNLGLSGQIAALALFLCFGQPQLYLWFVVGCGVVLLPLELRRELRAVRWNASSPAPRPLEPDGERSAAPGADRT